MEAYAVPSRGDRACPKQMARRRRNDRHWEHQRYGSRIEAEITEREHHEGPQRRSDKKAQSSPLCRRNVCWLPAENSQERPSGKINDPKQIGSEYDSETIVRPGIIWIKEMGVIDVHISEIGRHQ